MSQNGKDISLYIHIPFCTQRCSYCDFFFVTTRYGHDKFTDALCLELTQTSRNFPNTSVSTIYFGGGTPSILSSQAIQKILKQIHGYFDVSQAREVTLEANPEDITARKLDELLNAGITRISLGVQSFRDEDLVFMNRCHNSRQAVHAAKLIQSAGFFSWSLDLIFGVPGASMQVWKDNLQHAAETGVPHISTYGLTVEPYTPLHKQVQQGLINVVSDEQASDQFETAIRMLENADFEHYEISSFARPRHRSQHNTRYWYHLNYLGFGPGAHSFWRKDGQGRRWENIRNLRTYMELLHSGNSPVGSTESLTKRDLVREKIMLALRTSEGLDLDELQRFYDFNLTEHKQKELNVMELQGLLTWDQTSIQLTTKGMHMCDYLTRQLWTD